MQESSSPPPASVADSSRPEDDGQISVSAVGDADLSGMMTEHEGEDEGYAPIEVLKFFPP